MKLYPSITPIRAGATLDGFRLTDVGVRADHRSPDFSISNVEFVVTGAAKLARRRNRRHQWRNAARTAKRGLARAAIVAILILVGMLVAQPASATENRPQSTAFFVYDLLDPAAAPSWGNSGPQTRVEVVDGFTDPATIALIVAAQECGKGVQVDFLFLAEADIPLTVAPPTLSFEGVLRDAEHHATPECAVIPEQPADIVTGASSDVVDCTNRVIATSTTETRAIHLYDEATNTWTQQAPVTTNVGTPTVRPATEAECPTAVVAGTVTTSNTAPVAAVTPKPKALELASTGPVTDWLIPIGGALFFLGVFAVILPRARQHSDRS